MKTGISYYGNRIPKHVEEDLIDIVNHGCNFVVHTFSEEDYQFYQGTMVEIIKISHKLGLEVHVDPWGVGGVFGGEAYSYLVAGNLNIRQILSDGRSPAAACLNNENFRAYMSDWIDAAIEIGGDVIFWDEPRFYQVKGNENKNVWSCRCETCKKLFREHYGYEMPLSFTDDIKDFKQSQFLDFIKEMSGLVHQKGKRTAICLLPFEIAELGAVDWEEIAKIESLDILGTDPYWVNRRKKVEDYVRFYSKKVFDLARKYNMEPQIWIQAFKIPKERESEVETAVRVAYGEGIRNLVAWSYAGAGYMSCNRCENPELVWKILGESYRDCVHKNQA